MGYKWEYEYITALNDLRFSDAQRAQMVKRLTEGAVTDEIRQQDEANGGSTKANTEYRGARRHLRKIAAAVAVVIVLGGGIAGAHAAGTFDRLSDMFQSSLHLDEENELLADVIGKTCDDVTSLISCDNVRISLDGIIGDGINYAMSYTIETVDGSFLGIPHDVIETNEFGVKEAKLKFETEKLTPVSEGETAMDWHTSGQTYFYYRDKSKIQMVSIIGVSNANLQGCTIKQTFSNLRARSTTGNLVLAGPWELIYKLDSQDVSVELASNDKTTVNGEPLLIQELMISPIGYNVVFQTDAKLPTRNDERTYLPVVLTLKNGEEINLAELKNGGGSGENEEDYEHTQQSAFDTLIPIENMDYVTVGDKRYDISE